MFVGVQEIISRYIWSSRVRLVSYEGGGGGVTGVHSKKISEHFMEYSFDVFRRMYGGSFIYSYKRSRMD